MFTPYPPDLNAPDSGAPAGQPPDPGPAHTGHTGRTAREREAMLRAVDDELDREHARSAARSRTRRTRMRTDLSTMADLDRDDVESPEVAPRRPGTVVAAALLLWVGSALAALLLYAIYAETTVPRETGDQVVAKNEDIMLATVAMVVIALNVPVGLFLLRGVYAARVAVNVLVGIGLTIPWLAPPGAVLLVVLVFQLTSNITLVKLVNNEDARRFFKRPRRGATRGVAAE